MAPNFSGPGQFQFPPCPHYGGAHVALIAPSKRGSGGLNMGAGGKIRTEGLRLPSKYPQEDSNLYRQNRNLKSYPLDYGGRNVRQR